MRILLTGATGFLGSHLAKRFLTEGHDVVAFKRGNSSLARLGDIAGDIAWYDLAVHELSLPFQEHGQIDAIAHVATSYGRNSEPLSSIFEANTLMPLQLLEVAVQFKIPTFLNTDTVLDPRLNRYALSKRQFAEWGRMVAQMAGLRFVNVRLEHVYGEGDSFSKFTTCLVRQCLQNVPEIPLTRGEQMRDFIYVDDVVDAILLLLERQAELPPGFVELGLGSSCVVSIRTFAELVHTLCPSTSRLDFGALPYRKHEIMNSETDTSLLASLGWHPRFSLRDGLQKMIAREQINNASGEGAKL